MSSFLRGFRISLLYLLQSNIIIIFFLSEGESLVFAVNTDPVTGRAQIVSMPMTTNLADGINNIDNANTNTYPDFSRVSSDGGSTIPVTSGADSINQSLNPNNTGIVFGTLTNNNQPLESTSLNVVQYVSQNVVYDDGPFQLDDLESTAQNRGPNVQGDLIQGTINNAIQSEVIEGTDHSETIMGLQANDIIYGKGGDDIIYGDQDDDLIYGGAGDDLINGGEGDNKLDGEGRNDILIGGDVSDILSGGDGNDKLFGFQGNDVLKGGEGSNEFNCGEGIDTVLDFKQSRDLLSNDCEIVNQI
jgi:Ca2+-binding RTX toxin-like protein